jgi:hypothetical protein
MQAVTQQNVKKVKGFDSNFEEVIPHQFSVFVKDGLAVGKVRIVSQRHGVFHPSGSYSTPPVMREVLVASP